MDLLEALRELRTSLKALMSEPVGAGSLLAFVIGAIGYFGLPEFQRRARTVLLVIMCCGMMGVVSVDPDLPSVGLRLSTEGSGGIDPPASITIESNALPPLPYRGAGAVPTPGGGSDASSLTNASPAGTSFDAGRIQMFSREQLSWMPDGQLSDELWTEDRRCIDAQEKSCEATYRLSLRAGLSQRLHVPQLYCLEGPCETARVIFTRLSSNNRSVESSFVVWGGPTRWRLTASVETLRFVP